MSLLFPNNARLYRLRKLSVREYHQAAMEDFSSTYCDECHRTQRSSSLNHCLPHRWQLTAKITMKEDCNIETTVLEAKAAPWPKRAWCMLHRVSQVPEVTLKRKHVDVATLSPDGFPPRIKRKFPTPMTAASYNFFHTQTVYIANQDNTLQSAKA